VTSPSDPAETVQIQRHAYTIDETVKSVGLSRDTVVSAIDDKKLVATIVTPRKKVIRPRDVEAWLDSLPRTA
jgi:uncharacterized DUF497 family protein